MSLKTQTVLSDKHILIFFLTLALTSLFVFQHTLLAQESETIQPSPPLKTNPSQKPPLYINVDPSLNTVNSLNATNHLKRIKILERAVKQLQKHQNKEAYDTSYKLSKPYNMLTVLGKRFSNDTLDAKKAKTQLIKTCQKTFRKKACAKGQFEVIYPGRQASLEPVSSHKSNYHNVSNLHLHAFTQQEINYNV